MPRLNKYIASTGICSRRKADELILAGRVRVNDQKVEILGFHVREKDKVYIDGKLVKPQKLDYYKFYKPAGYITTADDEKNRKTIYDIIPEELHHLKPVGRLDKDSTGLIILTNDGEFINEMTHPSIKVPKVYLVQINGKFTADDAEKMLNGIVIETDSGEKKTAYAETLPIEVNSKSSEIQVVLYQGINRQIRKMFAKLGFEVKSLKRIQHATLTLEGLKRGQKMLKIAITGNIASGKSQVEKFISEKYTLYDADNIAHQILGNVDRKKLGEKVFSDPAARKKLEEFIHPKVKDEILKIFEQNLNVVFISIPLLFETGFDALFDKIIFVQCDDDIRLQRLMRRNDFTEEQALKRMNAQLPQKEKMQKSDFIIYNNSSLEDLEKQVLILVRELSGLI